MATPPGWWSCIFSYAVPSSKLSERRSLPNQHPPIQTSRRWRIPPCLPHQSCHTMGLQAPLHCWGILTPTLCKSVHPGCPAQGTPLSPGRPLMLGWLRVLWWGISSCQSSCFAMWMWSVYPVLKKEQNLWTWKNQKCFCCEWEMMVIFAKILVHVIRLRLDFSSLIKIWCQLSPDESLEIRSLKQWNNLVTYVFTKGVYIL